MVGCVPHDVQVAAYNDDVYVRQSCSTALDTPCTSCHRPQCTQHFENYPLDELTMPPPFQNATDFDHSSISDADRQAIRDWCNTLNLN